MAGARDARAARRVTVGLLDPALRLKSRAVGDGHRARSCRRRSSARCATGRCTCAISRRASRREAVPAAVDVTLRGSREALGRVDADDVAAFVDLAGLGAGEYTLPVHADSSRDAGVARIDPTTGAGADHQWQTT